MRHFKVILYEKIGKVAWITLNRPSSLNAMNQAMREELIQVLEDARDDNNICVVVITGSGNKAFCAGADINEQYKLSSTEQLGRHSRAHPIYLIRNIFKPVVAMVNGLALGGGCEIALACDLVLASENAEFGQAEIRVGLIPGAGGTQLLPRLIGEKRAKEMVFTGRSIAAKDAYQMGLVNQVVTIENLRETTEKLIAILLRRSPIILKIAKLAINRSLETNLYEGLSCERDLFALCFSTEDQKEGALAFIEKRAPSYKGK